MFFYYLVIPVYLCCNARLRPHESAHVHMRQHSKVNKIIGEIDAFFNFLVNFASQ